MKLQRENFYGSGVAGDWYSADDVDALLARIRAAVDAERVTAEYLVEYLADTGNVGIPQHPELERHRLALDALLSGDG